MAALDWTAWAPPLDPPAADGLLAGAAQAVADATWSTDPHLCAALQWESYAAMLPPALPTVPGDPWLRGSYWWPPDRGADAVPRRV